MPQLVTCARHRAGGRRGDATGPLFRSRPRVAGVEVGHEPQHPPDVASAGSVAAAVPICTRAGAGAAAAGRLAGVGGVEESGASAYTCFGEGEFDAVGCFDVPGDGGDDGADLLVSGHGQEGGGAAVGLHADEVDALFGVGQFAVAVRVDGAAGMLVGVDQRGEVHRGLEAFVEAEADLGEEREVGAEAGQHDDLVDGVQAAAVLSDQHQAAVAVPFHRLGSETGDRVGVSLVDSGLRRHAKSAARGQLVSLAAPKVEPLIPRRRTQTPCVPAPPSPLARSAR